MRSIKACNRVVHVWIVCLPLRNSYKDEHVPSALHEFRFPLLSNPHWPLTGFPAARPPRYLTRGCSMSKAAHDASVCTHQNASPAGHNNMFPKQWTPKLIGLAGHPCQLPTPISCTIC